MTLQDIVAAAGFQGKLHCPDWLSAMPETIAAQLTGCTFSLGETMIRDWDRAAYVCFLLEGSAAAVNVQADGEEYEFALFTAPAVFGEMEAFAQRRWYRGSVICRSVCRVLRLPLEAYLRWVRSDPELLFFRTREVIRALTLQARSEREQLFRSARERIILYLLDAQRTGGDGAYEVQATRRQIGDSSGCSEKTVQRELSKLASAGMISLRRGRVLMTETQMTELQKMIGRQTRLLEEDPS